MSKQLYVFTFPLWKRGKETVTSDAKVTAETLQEAAKKLLDDGVHNEWIIGDCCHVAYA